MILKLTRHSTDGEVTLLEVENYDAKTVNDIINGNVKTEDNIRQNTILLGNNIYSCIDIKAIEIVEEQTEETLESAE